MTGPVRTGCARLGAPPRRPLRRAAATLAQLWQGQHRAAEARDLLRPIYGQFTEGFVMADLQQAKNLLQQFS